MNDAPATGKIGVFLLDDHEIVRRGVRESLETEPDITVVGEAGTAESALARIPALRPNVAILDIRLPDGDGVSVCREIRSMMPEVACLMLTSFGDDEALFDAIMAGAAGYVLKQIHGTDLVGAVRTIASGESLLDPEAASRVMRRMRDQAVRRDPLGSFARGIGQVRPVTVILAAAVLGFLVLLRERWPRGRPGAVVHPQRGGQR
jgi:DNA-binding NarL/FixJ family response regulator